MEPASVTEVISGFSSATFAAIGAGFVAIGAGLGIGILAHGALNGMARQPELAGKIQLAMIIAAALIEGVAFFCAVICLQALSS